MRFLVVSAAIPTLGACGMQAGGRADINQEILSFDLGAERAFMLEDDGSITGSATVYVVAEEHGELHTYSLTPCRNGTHICGGSGRAGHLQQTAEFDVVTGAYPGRVFYFSPGGDGTLNWRRTERDLAWN